MKVCPICKEEIKDDALKCRHCHSMLVPGIAAGQLDAGPPSNGKTTYIVDEGVVRVGKFAFLFLSALIAVGVIFFGVDFRNTAQREIDLEKSEVASDKSSEELTKKQKDLNEQVEKITGELSELEARSEAAAGKTEEIANKAEELYKKMNPQALQQNPLPASQQADPASAIASIPWPQGQAPRPLPLSSTPDKDSQLPQSDYVVITYTAAEASALAAVLTPGYSAAAWYPYARNFDSKFGGIIKSDAPAASLHRLGRYFRVMIGNKSVLCFKSDLHLSTDGPSLPIKVLFRQIIEDASPKLIITTGTSGAIGSKLKLGDVVVASTCVFRCNLDIKALNGKQVSNEKKLPSPVFRQTVEKLLGANSRHLPSPGSPIIYWNDKQLGQATTIVTTDFFAFDDVQNTYALQGLGAAIESDDAVLGLVCEEIGSKAPAWLAIRNIADPQLTGSSLTENRTKAAQLYSNYGFWTTVDSAIATWAAIDGYPQ